MSEQPPPAPTASAIGPCPTIIQIVGRRGTGSLPRTIAPPDHPPSLGRGGKKRDIIGVMYKTIFVINIIIFKFGNIIMFCKFETSFYLSLREIIFSPKEFALLRILNLLPKEFAQLRIFCKFCVYPPK